MTPRIAPPSPALAAQLEAGLALPPEYGPGLSNHLPMALAALDGLGAGGARLHAFGAHYRKRLGLTAAERTADAPARWADGPSLDDSAALGDLQAFGAWRAAFAQRLQRDGTAATLRTSLPRLMGGVAAAAFHGVIRTAHAVESGHPGELAAALAYWAARWMQLPAPEPAAPRFASATEWLAALEQLRLEADAGWRPSGALITGRLHSATTTVAWRRLAGALAVDAEGATPGDDGQAAAPTRAASLVTTGPRAPMAAHLRRVALACADLYAATGDFTALHMATGSRAARVLAPWLDAGDAQVLAPLQHAIAAARLTVGRGAGDAVAGGAAAAAAVEGAAQGAAWDVVRQRALASDDEHVIKLVHAMIAQADGDPDPTWLRAAQRAVAPAG